MFIRAGGKVSEASQTFAATALRSFVERIERCNQERKVLSDDVRDIYAEAKASGFDKKALAAVVRLREKDPAERQEHEALVSLYWDALNGTLQKSTASVDESSEKLHARAGARTRDNIGDDMPDIPEGLRRNPANKKLEAAE